MSAVSSESGDAAKDGRGNNNKGAAKKDRAVAAAGSEGDGGGSSSGGEESSDGSGESSDGEEEVRGRFFFCHLYCVPPSCSRCAAALQKTRDGTGFWLCTTSHEVPSDVLVQEGWKCFGLHAAALPVASIVRAGEG